MFSAVDICPLWSLLMQTELLQPAFASSIRDDSLYGGMGMSLSLHGVHQQ